MANIRKKDIRIEKTENSYNIYLADFCIRYNIWLRKDAEYVKTHFWNALKEFDEKVNV